jgi:hypothetical protein
VTKLKLTKIRKRIVLVAFVAILALLSIGFFTQSFSICGYTLGLHQNLLLILKAHSQVVRMSGSINVVLWLINLGQTESVFHYSNSHTIDLFLYSISGTLVTYLTKDCFFLEVLSDIRLQPHEAKKWQIIWDNFDETGVTIPGPYFLEGSVLYFGTSRLPILILP